MHFRKKKEKNAGSGFGSFQWAVLKFSSFFFSRIHSFTVTYIQSVRSNAERVTVEHPQYSTALISLVDLPFLSGMNMRADMMQQETTVRRDG